MTKINPKHNQHQPQPIRTETPKNQFEKAMREAEKNVHISIPRAPVVSTGPASPPTNPPTIQQTLTESTILAKAVVATAQSSPTPSVTEITNMLTARFQDAANSVQGFTMPSSSDIAQMAQQIAGGSFAMPSGFPSSTTPGGLVQPMWASAPSGPDQQTTMQSEIVAKITLAFADTGTAPSLTDVTRVLTESFQATANNVQGFTMPSSSDIAQMAQQVYSEVA